MNLKQNYDGVIPEYLLEPLSDFEKAVIYSLEYAVLANPNSLKEREILNGIKQDLINLN